MNEYTGLTTWKQNGRKSTLHLSTYLCVFDFVTGLTWSFSCPKTQECLWVCFEVLVRTHSLIYTLRSIPTCPPPAANPKPK